MEALAEIDSRLEELDSQIARVVDVDSLRSQLATAASSTLNVKELGQIQKRDNEIARELECLQELWMLSTLKKEIEVNLELFEFETALGSLEKLNEKINAISLNTQAVKTKWAERATELHEKVIGRLVECWEQIVVVKKEENGCCSITFNESIEIDEFPVDYETLDEVVQQYSLPQNTFNVSHTIDSTLVNVVLEPQYKLSLTDTTITVEKYTAPNNNDLIITHTSSVKALIDFIALIPNHTRTINYISPRLFEKLKELITNHADVIYTDEQLKQRLVDLGSYLKLKGYNRADLGSWISSDLHGITIEHYLNEHIHQLRELFAHADFSLTSRTVTTKTAPAKQQEKIEQPKPVSKAKIVIEEDDGDDDDGWDNWGDGDDDDEEEEEDTKEEDVDDDGWDNWGDDDDEQEVKPKKLVSKLSKSKSPTPKPFLPQQTHTTNTLQTTQIPDQALRIIESYISTAKKLPHEHHAQHLSKVDYLTTTLFMLGSVSYPSPLMQYNDLDYLNSQHSFPSLVDLNKRLLLDFIKSYEQQIRAHYGELKGLDPSLSAGETMHQIEQIQTVFNELFGQISVLDQKTMGTLVISVMGDLYQMVIDSVMRKTDIGEVESEYLANLIAKFLDLKQPLGNDLMKYLKNGEKLKKIAFILTSHLKDIMETFNQGEFYEFETEEIISLIDKLFADSDRKRACIQEIREMRAEADA